MKTIFLYGPPGVGKLTVGKELAKLTSYKLFHNHLTVDLVHSVFDFKTPPFVELRHKIWMMVFNKAKEEGVDGMIFTFSPEESVPQDFIPTLISKVEDENNPIYFVELICDREELKRRIVDPFRKQFSKTRDPRVEKFYHRDHLIPKEVEERRIKIDNTKIGPKETAEKIVNHLGLKKDKDRD